MIKLTLFEEGYPDVYIAYDSIGGLADLMRRPSWEEGGLRRVTRIYLTHIPPEVIVCEPHARVKELIKLARPVDSPGFNPHIPCQHCNDIHLGADLHHKHEPKEGIGYIRLLAIGGLPEYCFRCGCRKSGWVNVTNEHLQDCPNRKCLCHTAERCH